MHVLLFYNIRQNLGQSQYTEGGFDFCVNTGRNINLDIVIISLYSIMVSSFVGGYHQDKIGRQRLSIFL